MMLGVDGFSDPLMGFGDVRAVARVRGNTRRVDAKPASRLSGQP